jgi:hypothetical protein
MHLGTKANENLNHQQHGHIEIVKNGEKPRVSNLKVMIYLQIKLT